jgi:hypothetical protein
MNVWRLAAGALVTFSLCSVAFAASVGEADWAAVFTGSAIISCLLYLDKVGESR